MKLVIPANLSCSNDGLLDIYVFLLRNKTYLIKDSKTNIQFRLPLGSISYEFVNFKTFYDTPYFKKIKLQNKVVGELFKKTDSFYIHCLYNELNRIVTHLGEYYVEFGTKIKEPNKKFAK